MKNTAINPAPLRSPSVLRCRNLRPDPFMPGTLRPVGEPAQVAPAGHRPLLYFVTPEGSACLVTAEGRRLYSCRPGVSAPRIAAALDGIPLCAAYAAGRVLVMTENGPRAFSYPGFEACGGADAGQCGIALRAVAGPRPLMVQVPGRSFNTDYRRETELDARDAAAVGTDLRVAYCVLAREAAAQGMMMQPAFARYRLLDAGGRVLFTSPPVLLGEAQCAVPVRMPLENGSVLRPYMLNAASWRLQLDIPADLPAGVHLVSVGITPQFHPVDPSEEAVVHLSVQSSATMLSIGMATAGSAILPASNSASARTALDAIARMDAMERIVATVAAVPGTQVEIECGPDRRPAEEIAAVRAAMKRVPEDKSRDRSLVAAPHGFTARCAAVNGESVLWADITPRLYGGYPLPLFAAQTDSSLPWSAWTAVAFADGSRAVWSGSGISGAPLKLNPVLSYPSADAVSLTVGLRTGSGPVLTRTFPLTAVAGGGAAVYVDPSCAPMDFGGEAGGETQPPMPVSRSTSERGMLVAADAGLPFAALAACTLPQTVLRVLPAEGNAGSWDFGRTRFTAFGTGGTARVTLNSARDILVTARRDSRPVVSPAAVAQGTDGTVYAIAGGDLLRVAPSGCTTRLHGTAHKALAFDCATGELWCAGAGDGEAEVMLPEGGPLQSYRRSCGTPEAVLGCPGGTFVQTAGGVLALHQERSGRTEVEWAGVCRPGAGRPARVRTVLADMAGGDVDLTLSAAAAGSSSPEPQPGTSLHVKGDVRGPVRMRLLSRPLHRLHLSVSGTVGSDFRLSEFTLL